MWIDTWVGSGRKSHPCGSLSQLYGAFLPSFYWPVILLCLVLNPYLGYDRVLPCVRAHPLAKMNSSEEADG